MNDPLAVMMAAMWAAIAIIWTGAVLDLYGPMLGLSALVVGGAANIWIYAMNGAAT